MTIFLVDYPYETGRRLFEVFLLQGEKFMFKIMIKFAKYKERQILEMPSHFIMKYIRYEMIVESLREKGSIKEMLK